MEYENWTFHPCLHFPLFFFPQSEAYTDDILLNAQYVTSARRAVLIKTMKTKDVL